MPHTFRNPAVPPLSADQLCLAGIDPDALFWSPTFCCWRFCGELAVRFPLSSAGQILTALGLVPNPDA